MTRVIHGESPQSLARLSRDQRLTLLKFACAAVWADLEVSESERSFIQSLALRLGLPDDDVGHVRDWLETPPTPEEVDPSLILPEHRKLFLEAVREAIAADHVVDDPEIESLRLLEELLG